MRAGSPCVDALYRTLAQVDGRREPLHVAEDPGLALQHVRSRVHDAGVRRRRQHGRERGGLGAREARVILAEVDPARRLDAPDAAAELRAVEVDLEDPALRPEELDPHGEPGLEALAHPALPA